MGICTSGKLWLLASLSLAAATVQPVSTAWGEDKTVIIGTGSRAGVYFQVGRAICRLVNRAVLENKIDCQAPATAGSIANLKAVRASELQLAVAQSDWQFHALNGTGSFASAKPDPDLRAVFSVHGEPFTLVVRRDAKIAHLRDVEGKRVNIGNPGSGQRGTMEVVMKAMGWTKSSFSLTNELPASQQSLALCHDQVEAMVYTVGHPNDSIAQAARLCDAVIAEVSGSEIEKLIAQRPYYAHTAVPGGLYPGNPNDVKTFGVKATLVTSAKVDAQTIYDITKVVFENFGAFRAMHPAFAKLDPKTMIADGLSAPLHEGALRYYKERGWL